MAAPTFLTVDMESSALQNWQLCKSRSVTQSFVTAQKLSQALRDVGFDQAFEVIDVSGFGAIRVQPWGVADNNDGGTSPTLLDLYGWSDGGPGYHIGTVDLIWGNSTSPANTGFHASQSTHTSIRDAFDAATAYRFADTITASNDYEAAITAYTLQADWPGHFDVSFANNQYKYFGIAVTNLGTPAATNVGAIFKVLSIKTGYHSPQFTG